MSYQQIDLDPTLFLGALLENLNSHFFANSRDESKQLYMSLAGQKAVPFMHVNAAESGEIFCDLALDNSQYVGKLNYGQFRKCLAVMMHSISNRIEAKQDLNVMNSENGDILFNVPGIVQSDSTVNVLVSGISQAGPGKIVIRLMFLEPSQYITAVSPETDAAAES
jgi:hypothetical protein